jgi:Flp pilus assembly protein protease CpaA
MIMIGAVEDLRSRRIANWINITLLILGFSTQFYLNGFEGLATSALGVLVATLVCTILFQLRIFGGGDLKLFVAVSAMTGYLPFLFLLGLSLVWASIFGIARALFSKSLGALVSNIFSIFISKGFLPEKSLQRIPFTIPMFFGWLSYWSLIHHGVLP